MTLDQHLRFTLDLQHRMFPDDSTNSCWSPLSVASCLGLLAESAVGTTRHELTEVLLGGGADSIVDDQAEFLARAGSLPEPTGRLLSAGQQPELAISNTLWVDQSVRVDTDFVDLALATWPGGAVRTAPFATAPDDCRVQINSAVAKQTRDLIPHLLGAGSITRDTVAALVNAVYLRTGWCTPFRRRRTTRALFNTPAGQTEVDMMCGTAAMRHAHLRGWEVVDVPALGGVSATVLLPDASLAEANAQLDAALLAELIDATTRDRVELLMPRLSVHARPALMPALAGAGVQELFSERAALDGLVRAGGDRLTVSAMAHEAVLRVDENGLEGAAATAAVVSRAIGSIELPTVVIVDRPFLLLIRHRATGVVYFFARVTNP